MQYTIRPVTPQDEDILWLMLFYAARVNYEEGKTVEDARANPDLVKYVNGWGRDGDLGFVAVDESDKAVGAVWVRYYTGDKKTHANADESIPELSIAVLPQVIGQGIGTKLMQHLLDAAKGQFSAVGLNVRAENPALRLYKRLGFVITGELTNRVGTLSYDMRLTFEK